MAVLTLEILQKSYRWELPQGAESITASALKDHIGERAKGEVLYHKKLSFASNGKVLDDSDEVPLAPSVVQVKGPGSVVQMFGLFCDKGGRPVQRPKAPAPTPAPRPSAQDRPLPAARGCQDMRHFDFGGRGSPFAQSLQSGFRQQANPMAFNATSDRQWPSSGGWTGRNPPPSSPRQGASGYGSHDETVMKNWLNSLAEHQQFSEEQDFSKALLASQATFEADEEAQLRWALEESARMAEEIDAARNVELQSAEEIKKYYMEDLKGGQHKSKSLTPLFSSFKPSRATLLVLGKVVLVAMRVLVRRRNLGREELPRRKRQRRLTEDELPPAKRRTVTAGTCERDASADEELAAVRAALDDVMSHLLGRPPTPEDRVFRFDADSLKATMELPSLSPPRQLECLAAVEPVDGQELSYGELSRAERASFEKSVEQKISHLMLKVGSRTPLILVTSGRQPPTRWTEDPSTLHRQASPPPAVQKGSSVATTSPDRTVAHDLAKHKRKCATVNEKKDNRAHRRHLISDPTS
ncbi:unnamed protein product [Symbiodinium necroappetens]|uniref:Uncharacterized protein n=1 Tax=Symbiodinium necroappetens TaxID=1628268 RepID=A0A812XES2_9DINO|nr:unnamed protein product [Symbiodinium necroappetens]